MVRQLIPPPDIEITANPNTFPPGGGVSTLTWLAFNTPDGGVFIDHGIGWVNASGSINVDVSITTIFTASAYNEAGSDTDSATIIVTANPLCSTYTDPSECIANNCFWYNESCHGNPECSPDGIQECRGNDLFECQGGNWVMIEQSSADCGVDCSPDGIFDCVALDLYKCIGGVWVLEEVNSKTCGWVECQPNGLTKCIGEDYYECLDGEWVLVETNSPSCIQNGGCEGLSETECNAATGCFWYQKYIWEEPKCHSTEQNMLMDYLPFIAVGGAGVIILVVLLSKRSAPQYYPPPPPMYYPPPPQYPNM